MYYAITCRQCDWRCADRAAKSEDVLQAFFDHVKAAHADVAAKIFFVEHWITDEIVEHDLLSHPGLGPD